MPKPPPVPIAALERERLARQPAPTPSELVERVRRLADLAIRKAEQTGNLQDMARAIESTVKVLSMPQVGHEARGASVNIHVHEADVDDEPAEEHPPTH